APLETAFGTLGIPYAIESRLRLDRTPFGQALVSLIRFAWLGGGRRDLYAFLRSPYSGFNRTNVDFLEGRLRGRAVEAAERVEEETIRLRDGQSIAPLEAVRSAPTSLDAVQGLAASTSRRSSATTSAATSTRTETRVLLRATTSRATATSSTPSPLARRAVCTSSAKRQPTTATRASRARSGTKSGVCSRTRTSVAGLDAGRSL